MSQVKQMAGGFDKIADMKLFGLAVVLAVVVSGCGGGADTPTAPTGPVAPAIPRVPSANVPFSTVNLRVGTGAEANTGRRVTVNYSGYLYSEAGADNKGTRFDSGSFAFTVGTGVISGFSQGVIGMRVGGLRRVIIPPSLGYGNNPPAGSGIPAGGTLVFDIELVAVQ